MTRLRNQTGWALPICLVALALALHWVVILGRDFDGLYGQDSFAYFRYSAKLRASLSQLRRPPPFFWPIGYPALVAVISIFAGLSPRAGQIVSSFTGAGCVLFVYMLARDLLTEQGASKGEAYWVGGVAGLLMLASGQLWQWSITTMADTAALFWATLAAWALIRYWRAPWPAWLYLVAVTLALALITRWVYGLLVIPFGLIWLRFRAGDAKARVRHLAFACLAGVVVLAPQLAVSMQSPNAVVNHHWLTGWSPLNLIRREFVHVDGHDIYPLPNAVFYAKAAASPRSLFPLFTPFVLLGAWLIGRPRWFPAAILLLGWGGVTFVFLSGVPYQNFRYALSLLPPVVILAAIGLRRIWDSGAAPRAALLLYILVGVVGGIAYSARVLDEFIDRKDADLVVASWVDDQTPDGAHVVSFGITLMLEHYTALDVNDLFLVSRNDLAKIPAAGRPTYLVIPEESLETQWRDHPMGYNYRWLRTTLGLESLGSKEGYTLFRIDG